MADYLKFTVLKSVQSLQCLSLEEIVKLVKAFDERTMECGTVICEQGMLSNQFYIVARGKLLVMKDNRMRGILHEYSFFGERSIRDDDVVKMTTVVDTANALIFSLSRARFEETVGTLESLEARATCAHFLKKLEILSTLTQSELVRVAGECVVEEYSFGETIINEGDVGTSFYLLTKGTTEVRKSGSADVIMSYTSGMYFGERALLEDEPRSASVTVSSPVAQVLRIDREAFDKHLFNLRDLIRDNAALLTEMQAEEAMQPSDFEFIQYLGVGMYGRVKLLQNRSTGKRYALKCISKKQVVEQSVEKQLARECQAAMVMKSYFTARVINCFMDSTWIYMLTELVPGGELFYHLHLSKGTRFPEKKAKFYVANVLLGLEFMHRKSYAYRDLKLENIILDYRGCARRPHAAAEGASARGRAPARPRCLTPSAAPPAPPPPHLLAHQVREDRRLWLHEAPRQGGVHLHGLRYAGVHRARGDHVQRAQPPLRLLVARDPHLRAARGRDALLLGGPELHARADRERRRANDRVPAAPERGRQGDYILPAHEGPERPHRRRAHGHPGHHEPLLVR